MSGAEVHGDIIEHMESFIDERVKILMNFRKKMIKKWIFVSKTLLNALVKKENFKIPALNRGHRFVCNKRSFQKLRIHLRQIFSASH